MAKHSGSRAGCFCEAIACAGASARGCIDSRSDCLVVCFLIQLPSGRRRHHRAPSAESLTCACRHLPDYSIGSGYFVCLKIQGTSVSIAETWREPRRALPCRGDGHRHNLRRPQGRGEGMTDHPSEVEALGQEPEDMASMISMLDQRRRASRAACPDRQAAQRGQLHSDCQRARGKCTGCRHLLRAT